MAAGFWKELFLESSLLEILGVRNVANGDGIKYTVVHTRKSKLQDRWIRKPMRGLVCCGDL